MCNQKLIRQLLIVVICLLPISVVAQVVYQCDFEDATERNQWNLNPGPRSDRCENKWYIGSAGDYSMGGHYGLYVAAQNTPDTLCYTSNASMMTVAYRKIKLEKGQYRLRFDWIGKLKNTGNEGVYVYWVEDDPVKFEITSMPTTDLLQWQKETTYCLNSFETTKDGNINIPLYNQGVWNSSSLSLKVDDDTEERLLMFVFFASKGTPTNPSFAIDNIQIAYDTPCEKPTNIEHKLNADGSVTVSWKGSSDAELYEIRLKDLQNGIWYSDYLVNNPTLFGPKLQYDFTSLEEGAQLFQIRAICGMDEDGQMIYSDWVSYNFFYYRRGERCIEYMQLDNTTCSWQHAYTEGDVGRIPRNLTNRGAVDNGYDDYNNSYHTLHYMPNEYDPYTMNHLATKPDGALAAVRIGIMSHTHISRVRYTYQVPENEERILVIRYALVLPNPHPDKPEQNPVFTMETLIDGKPVDGGCGDANFTSGFGDVTEWDNAKNYGGQDIFFKDWTTVSLNMKEYAGKTFTLTFTTTGCTPSGHGGYGYLTVNCESGQMSGLNCGEDNPTTTFTAPVGFGYRWWKDDRSDVLSTKQSFTISPMDTATYHVDLIALGNEQCYHTLDVTGIPRIPKIEAGFKKYEMVACQNEVTFYNNSQILYKAYKKVWDPIQQDSILVVDREFTKGDRLNHILWDFGDGSPRELNKDSLVTHIYPKEGGTFIAKMIGTLDGTEENCLDSVDIPITIPAVGYADVNIHEGRGYTFYYQDGTRGSTYWSVGEDTIVEKIGDCDLTSYIHIHETNFTIDTTICEGGYFMVGDNKYDKVGTYEPVRLKSVQWPNVDSIVTLNLKVIPELKVQHADTIYVCADADKLYVPLQIVQGSLDSIHILFSQAAVTNGFDNVYSFADSEDITIDVPRALIPGFYYADMKLGTARCPVPDESIVLQINYSSSVLYYIPGIVGVLSSDYNGGYDIIAYQWYFNGKPIDGANNSYCYIKEIGEYTVMLTRSDQVTVAVCPVYFNGSGLIASDIDNDLIASSSTVYPTIVAAGQMLNVISDSAWMLTDVLGRVLIPYSTQTSVQAPATSGVYIITFLDTHRSLRIIVK